MSSPLCQLWEKRALAGRRDWARQALEWRDEELEVRERLSWYGHRERRICSRIKMVVRMKRVDIIQRMFWIWIYPKRMGCLFCPSANP